MRHSTPDHVKCRPFLPTVVAIYLAALWLQQQICAIANRSCGAVLSLNAPLPAADGYYVSGRARYLWSIILSSFIILSPCILSPFIMPPCIIPMSFISTVPSLFFFILSYCDS